MQMDHGLIPNTSLQTCLLLACPLPAIACVDELKNVHTLRLSETHQSKAQADLFRSNNPTKLSVRMAYKGQISLGIIAILYTYQAYKTLFGPIKPTNQSIQMVIKARSVLETLHTQTVFGMLLS